MLMSKIFLLFLLHATFLVSAQSYSRLHKNAIVIDTHNDVLSSVTMKGLSIEKDLSGITHSDIHRLQMGGIDIQVFSVFCDERFGKGMAFNYANAEIDSLSAIVKRNLSRMMMVTDPKQLMMAVKQKKIGCMIGLEGGHMIEDDLSNLDALFQRGARYMTLTWNNSTSWATSAWDETTKKDSLPHMGLTDFGVQVVKHMNDLGMLVDVSHVGETTLRDVIRVTTKPVIASHSCVYNLCPVPRNLKDDQIKAIGKNGGVIHLNFYSGFVDSTYNRRKNEFLKKYQREVDSLKTAKFPSYEMEDWVFKKHAKEANDLRPPMTLLMDHLDYIVRLIGVDHVGIGSDFDGIESSPQTLDDVSSFPLLTKSLLERGYSKKEIKKILGGNFIRVFSLAQSKK